MDNIMDSHVYRFLTACSRERSPYNLCSVFVREAERLVPYDQARIIFINEDGKIASSLLYGVEQKNWKKFLHFYENEVFGSRFSLKQPLRLAEEDRINLCDWTEPATQRQSSQFYTDYVKPLRLKYCLGMGFTDEENCLRSIISLDRTRDVPYEKGDIELLKYLYPLVNGYHIDLYSGSPKAFSQNRFILDQYELTNREQEIANLLLRGTSTAGISERLCISKNTVYRHIANIFEKIGVTNRSEFICLMNQEDSPE